jgi:SAM-dependent methyltransferase
MGKPLLSLPFVRNVVENLDPEYARDDFVAGCLKALPAGTRLLDAGCGSQRYRRHCGHLEYRAQDFGGYSTDEKKMLGSEGVGGTDGYRYGALDYVGDIWDIDEADATFGAVLCTEVLEHIPYPIETVRELCRLLRPGGRLILTAPANALRHMDPYFFNAGLSDRWYQKFLPENGMTIETLRPVGDYYRWLAVEMARTAWSHSLFAKIVLSPAFLYFYNKKPTPTSTDTLCLEYYVVAVKQGPGPAVS